MLPGTLVSGTSDLKDHTKSGTYGIDVITAAAGAAKKKNTPAEMLRFYDAAIQFIEQHKDGPFYIKFGAMSRTIKSILLRATSTSSRT